MESSKPRKHTYILTMIDGVKVVEVDHKAYVEYRANEHLFIAQGLTAIPNVYGVRFRKMPISATKG